METESDLIFKLFTTHHLNVPERNALPNRSVRKTAAEDLILKKLNARGCFPFSRLKKMNASSGECLQIEKKGNEAILHRNVEVSYLTYAHFADNYSSIPEAINAYLKILELTGLDGIPIDWNK